jgi:hypothetical protein
MLRYLRLAVTSLGAIPCLLLVALWVRSYTHCDSIHILRHRITSLHGKLYFDRRFHRSDTTVVWETYGFAWMEYSDRYNRGGVQPPRNRKGFVIPAWLAIALSMAFTAAPWIRWKWRFSLRTLLIAMALVATVLGIIMASN